MPNHRQDFDAANHLRSPRSAKRAGSRYNQVVQEVVGKPARHYPNFDLLRLFLAAEVVNGHLNIFIPHRSQPWPINPVPAFVGISGFLVLGSLERTGSYGRFVWKRVCRVVPAFVASLVLVLVLFGTLAMGTALLRYFELGIPGGGPNVALWSLSAEELLYALMALLFGWKFYQSRSLVSGVVLATLVAIPFVIGTETRIIRLGWLPTSFFLGSLCYLFEDRLEKIPKWFWPTLLVFVGILLPTRDWLPRPLSMRMEWQAVAALGSFAVVGMGAWGPVITPRRMPDLSYGLYVYHYPIIAWFAGQKLNPWWGVMSAIILSIASWYLLESRFIRLKGIKMPSRRQSDITRIQGVGE